MSNRLVVNPGTSQAWEIELKPGVNRLGRGEQNDFIISHQSISTHHCEITVSDTAVTLKDLGSTNGSFVDRSPVTEVQLKPGQHVQFGAVDMIFESSSVAPTAPSPPPIGGLRVSQPRETTSPPPPPKPIQSATTSSQPNTTGFKPVDSQPGDSTKGNFALSLTGVCLGAAIGLVAWHLIYRYTGLRVGFMALATGVLAGAAPQLIGHYHSKLLGVLAAIITLAAIFTAQYLNARIQFDEFMVETQDDNYNEQVTYAKRVVTAIPNETDEEIRSFLAGENSNDEMKVKPEEIEAAQVDEFKTGLPKLRELASGKTTKEDFNKALVEGKDALEKSGFLRIYFIIRGLGIFNIVNIVLGTGAAYLTAASDVRRR